MNGRGPFYGRDENNRSAEADPTKLVGAPFLFLKSMGETPMARRGNYMLTIFVMAS
jgi:hypothetical protein